MKRGNRRGFTTFVVSSLTMGAFFVISVYAILPTNVLSTDKMRDAAPHVNTVWPQGWAFFSLDPDLPDYGIYQESSTGVYDDLLTTPNVRPENLYGLSRSGRAQGPEYAMLTNQLPDDRWHECDSGREECMSEISSEDPITLENNAPAPTICGDAVFTSERPSPWAYRDLTDEHFRLEQGIHVTVTCEA